MKNCRIEILSLILVCCIEMIGCAKESDCTYLETTPPSAEYNEFQSEEYSEETILKGTGKDENQFTKDKEEYIDELNLDGRGGQNDSIRLTSYMNQNDVQNSYVLMEVTLNQNETIQKQFTGFHKNSISITHGNLFAQDIEGFVIQLRYFGSNYGASDIYAYEVINNNGNAELVERLSLKDSDGENDSRKEPISSLYRFKDEFVFDGEACFIEELNQCGILLQFYKDKEIPAYTIYWKDDDWKIFDDTRLEKE